MATKKKAATRAAARVKSAARKAAKPKAAKPKRSSVSGKITPLHSFHRENLILSTMKADKVDRKEATKRADRDYLRAHSKARAKAKKK